MNFEDTLKIGAKVYNVGYLQIGDRCYAMNDDGTPNFDDVDDDIQKGFDENGNAIEVKDLRFLDFGKCIILPNTSARSVTLLDGKQYVYSYELIAPLSKRKYYLLPKEGDKVWITKKDSTIDRQMEVKGFVTYKKRYLKLWL
jgi:hypothetical protein